MQEPARNRQLYFKCLRQDRFNTAIVAVGPAWQVCAGKPKPSAKPARARTQTAARLLIVGYPINQSIKGGCARTCGQWVIDDCHKHIALAAIAMHITGNGVHITQRAGFDVG